MRIRIGIGREGGTEPVYKLGKIIALWLIILVLSVALFNLFQNGTKSCNRGATSDPERPRGLPARYALADGKSLVRVPVLGYFRRACARANGALALTADPTIKWRMSGAGFTVV